MVRRAMATSDDERRELDARATRSSFERGYWLSRCEGFRVFASDGKRLGIVDTPIFDSQAERPDLLLVRAGFFGRRLVTISIDEVEAVLPREKKIVLR